MSNFDSKRKVGRPKGKRDKNSLLYSKDYEISETGEIKLTSERQEDLAAEALKMDVMNKKKGTKQSTYGKPYASGNNYGKGRTQGSKNKGTAWIRSIGEEYSELAIRQMVEWMKAGDKEATRFLLERIYPIRKGLRHYLNYDCGTLKTLQDIDKISEHVTTLMVEGEISAEEAEEYGKAIERRMRIIIDSKVMDKIEDTCKKVEAMKDM
jgi:polyhydroxyalkanoate synthesis regulator phasin